MDLFDVQKRIVPDMIDVMQKRYQILQYIHNLEPVGRRILAQSLHLTERVLRSEVEFLRKQNLLSVSPVGMSLTEEGKIILAQLEKMIRGFSGIPELERRLANYFHIHTCHIVPGDVDQNKWGKAELGKTCARELEKIVKPGQIISVTGGTSVGAVADAWNPQHEMKDLLFVPARGGIGSDVKNQASTLCEKMAMKTKGQHMVLYSPDAVTKEFYDSLMQDSAIRDVLEKIKSADIVIHGIGNAMTMARRRNSSKEVLQILQDGKAIAEAFGYYFDENGEVVYKLQTVGLQMEELANIPHIFAVAGGTSKVKAIKAYMKTAPKNTILVTDEAVALALLEG